MGQTHNAAWQLVGKAYRDGLSRALNSAPGNPLALSSKSAWAGLLSSLGDDVELGRNFAAWLNDAATAAWGFLDGLTFGLTSRIRDLGNWVMAQTGTYQFLDSIGLGGLAVNLLQPDKESAAYRGGYLAGEITAVAVGADRGVPYVLR